MTETTGALVGDVHRRRVGEEHGKGGELKERVHLGRVVGRNGDAGRAAIGWADHLQTAPNVTTVGLRTLTGVAFVN